MYKVPLIVAPKSAYKVVKLDEQKHTANLHWLPWKVPVDLRVLGKHAASLYWLSRKYYKILRDLSKTRFKSLWLQRIVPQVSQIPR